MATITGEEGSGSGFTRGGLIVLALAFVVWSGVVAFSAGLGWNSLPVEWNFERTGQLGDSFGVVSAGMATLAAIFTLETLRRQRAEGAQQLEREQRREAEQTLFRLMELRTQLISSLHVRSGFKRLSGQQALAHIAAKLSDEITRSQSTDQIGAYNSQYTQWADQLGHYFRLTYHIVRFADENLPLDTYSYIRLLRAQLSNLLALNCYHGEGREKFARYVTRYALLHNIKPEDAFSLQLEVLFAPGAFSFGAPSEPSIFDPANPQNSGS